MKLTLSIDLTPRKQQAKLELEATINAYIQRMSTSIKDQDLIYAEKLKQAQNVLAGNTQGVDLLQQEATIRQVDIISLAQRIIYKNSLFLNRRHDVEVSRVKAGLEIDACRSVREIQQTVEKWMSIINNLEI